MAFAKFIIASIIIIIFFIISMFLTNINLYDIIFPSQRYMTSKENTMNQSKLSNSYEEREEFCNKSGYTARVGPLPRIFDGFIFNIEKEILKVRLEELFDIVDWFIIVEGNVTFQGKKKPLVLLESMQDEFQQYSEKILNVILYPSLYPNNSTGSTWDNERFQRDAIYNQVKYRITDDDILIVTDVDEIPRANTIKVIKHCNVFLSNFHYLRLNLDFFYYSLHWLVGSQAWAQPAVALGSMLKTKSVSAIRYGTTGFTIIPNAGWHCSYFGGVQAIQKKLTSFSHREYSKPPYTSEDYILSRISNGVSLFDNGKFNYIENITDGPSIIFQYPNNFSAFFDYQNNAQKIHLSNL